MSITTISSIRYMTFGFCNKQRMQSVELNLNMLIVENSNLINALDIDVNQPLMRKCFFSMKKLNLIDDKDNEGNNTQSIYDSNENDNIYLLFFPLNTSVLWTVVVSISSRFLEMEKWYTFLRH